MVVQPHFNDLVVGTYGRGFWIMDDITPLQQLTDDVLKSDAHLFNPRPAYRLHRRRRRAVGCARGVSSTIILKDVPSGEVKITILDEEGRRGHDPAPGPRSRESTGSTWNLWYPGPGRPSSGPNRPEIPMWSRRNGFTSQWETGRLVSDRELGVLGGIQGIPGGARDIHGANSRSAARNSPRRSRSARIRARRVRWPISRSR